MTGYSMEIKRTFDAFCNLSIFWVGHGRDARLLGRAPVGREGLNTHKHTHSGILHTCLSFCLFIIRVYFCSFKKMRLITYSSPFGFIELLLYILTSVQALCSSKSGKYMWKKYMWKRNKKKTIWGQQGKQMCFFGLAPKRCSWVTFLHLFVSENILKLIQCNSL